MAIGTLDTALYFLDCTQKHFFDEAIALEKLNTNQTLTQRQKWLVHQQLCTSVGVAIEKGRAVWRNGPEGTWPELNWLLELNGLPRAFGAILRRHTRHAALRARSSCSSNPV